MAPNRWIVVSGGRLILNVVSMAVTFYTLLFAALGVMLYGHVPHLYEAKRYGDSGWSVVVMCLLGMFLSIKSMRSLKPMYRPFVLEVHGPLIMQTLLLVLELIGLLLY